MIKQLAYSVLFLITLQCGAVTLLLNNGTPISSELEKCVVFFDEGQQDVIIQAKYKGDEEELIFIQPVPKGTKVERVLYPPFNDLDFNPGQPMVWTPARKVSKYISILGVMGGHSVVYEDSRKRLYKPVDNKELKPKSLNQLKGWFNEQKLKIEDFEPYESLSQKEYEFVAIKLKLQNEWLEVIETYLPPIKFSFPTSKPVYPVDLIFNPNNEKHIDFHLLSTSLYTADIKIEKRDIMTVKEFFTKAIICNPDQTGLIKMEPLTFSTKSPISDSSGSSLKMYYEFPRTQDLEFVYCTRFRNRCKTVQLNNKLSFVADFKLIKAQANKLQTLEEQLGYKELLKTAYVWNYKPLIDKLLKPRKLTEIYAGHRKKTTKQETKDDEDDDFDTVEDGVSYSQTLMEEYLSIINKKMEPIPHYGKYIAYPFFRDKYIEEIKNFNHHADLDSVVIGGDKDENLFGPCYNSQLLYVCPKFFDISGSSIIYLFAEVSDWQSHPFKNETYKTVNEAFYQLCIHFDPIIGELLLPWLKSKNNKLRLTALQAMCLASINAPNNSYLIAGHRNPDMFIEDSIDRYMSQITPFLDYNDPDPKCRTLTFIFAALNDHFSDDDLEEYLQTLTAACSYNISKGAIQKEINKLITQKQDRKEQQVLTEFYNEFESKMQSYTKPIICTLLIEARRFGLYFGDELDALEQLSNINVKYWNGDEYAVFDLYPTDIELMTKLGGINSYSEVADFCKNPKTIPALLLHRERVSKTVHEVINVKLKEKDDPWLRLLKILFKPSQPYSSEDTIKICREVKAALRDKSIKEVHFVKFWEYCNLLLSRSAMRYINSEIDKVYPPTKEVETKEKAADNNSFDEDKEYEKPDPHFEKEYKKLID